MIWQIFTSFSVVEYLNFGVSKESSVKDSFKKLLQQKSSEASRPKNSGTML